MIESIEVLYNNIKRIIEFPFRIIWMLLAIPRAYRVVVYMKSGSKIVFYANSCSIGHGRDGCINSYSWKPVGCVPNINVMEISAVVVYN